MLIYFDTKTNFIPPKGLILGIAKRADLTLMGLSFFNRGRYGFLKHKPAAVVLGGSGWGWPNPYVQLDYIFLPDSGSTLGESPCTAYLA